MTEETEKDVEVGGAQFFRTIRMGKWGHLTSLKSWLFITIPPEGIGEQKSVQPGCSVSAVRAYTGTPR